MICNLPAGHSEDCNGFPRFISHTPQHGLRYCRPLVVEYDHDHSVNRYGVCRICAQRKVADLEAAKARRARVVAERHEQDAERLATRNRELKENIRVLEAMLRQTVSEREQLREDHQAALTAIERLQATLRAERAAPREAEDRS